jgi:NhaP-type Na+/H+ and K+/H+ antiporter
MTRFLGILRSIAQLALGSITGYMGFMGFVKIISVIDPKVGKYDDYVMSFGLFLIALCLNIAASSLVVYLVGRFLRIRDEADQRQWRHYGYCFLGGITAIFLFVGFLLIAAIFGMSRNGLVFICNLLFFTYYFWTAAGATIGFNLASRYKEPN